MNHHLIPTHVSDLIAIGIARKEQFIVDVKTTKEIICNSMPDLPAYVAESLIVIAWAPAFSEFIHSGEISVPVSSPYGHDDRSRRISEYWTYTCEGLARNVAYWINKDKHHDEWVHLLSSSYTWPTIARALLIMCTINAQAPDHDGIIREYEDILEEGKFIKLERPLIKKSSEKITLCQSAMSLIEHAAITNGMDEYLDWLIWMATECECPIGEWIERLGNDELLLRLHANGLGYCKFTEGFTYSVAMAATRWIEKGNMRILPHIPAFYTVRALFAAGADPDLPEKDEGRWVNAVKKTLTDNNLA